MFVLDRKIQSCWEIDQRKTRFIERMKEQTFSTRKLYKYRFHTFFLKVSVKEYNISFLFPVNNPFGKRNKTHWRRKEALFVTQLRFPKVRTNTFFTLTKEAQLDQSGFYFSVAVGASTCIKIHSGRAAAGIGSALLDYLPGFDFSDVDILQYVFFDEEWNGS